MDCSLRVTDGELGDFRVFRERDYTVSEDILFKLMRRVRKVIRYYIREYIFVTR